MGKLLREAREWCDGWSRRATQPADAVYLLNMGGVEGKGLEGENKYVMHFSKEEFPPGETFWSITPMTSRDSGWPTSSTALPWPAGARLSSTPGGRWIRGSRASRLVPIRRHLAAVASRWRDRDCYRDYCA